MSSAEMLHEAIVNRDLETVKRILVVCQSWEPTDVHGETVLHLAFKCKNKCISNQKAIIKILECFLQKGLSVDLKNAAGQTVLFLAVEDRLRHVIDYLVQCGANINVQDQNGNSIIDTLIEDQFKRYPKNASVEILESVEQDDRSFMNWLLLKNANVHLRNNEAKSVFHLATQRNLKHILPTLVKHMNDVDYIVEDGTTIVKSFFRRMENMNTKYDVEVVDNLCAFVDLVDKKGNTLGHMFLKWCGRNSKMIQRVLQSYANLDAQDEDGNTVLYLVIRSNFINIDKQHIVDAVRTLLSKGANPSLENHSEDAAVHLAIRLEHFEVFKDILEYGADVNPSSHPGIPILHHICSVRGSGDQVWAPMVDKLVRAGWNVNDVRPHDSFTPLMVACRSSCPAIAQKLIDNGANANYVTKGSLMRPIHVAARSDYSNREENAEIFFNILAKAGANVNVKNSRGETALHLAVYGSYSMVSRLLKLGARVNVRDNLGRLPLQEAAEKGNAEAIKALLHFGAEVNDAGILREVTKLMVEQMDYDNRMLPDLFFDLISPEKRATVDYLMKHWLRLKAANLPAIDGYAGFAKKDSLQEFYSECPREVKTLKTQNLNDRTTLYNLLHMDVHVKYIFIEKTLKELVTSPTLKTDFPKYYPLIIVHYNMAAARYPLIETAKRAWDNLTGIRLPDCIEQILVYLNNEDLTVMAEEEGVDSLKRLSNLALGVPTKRI